MIRVRELLEFIQRNPNLVDYDAPVQIIRPSEAHDDDTEVFDITELRLASCDGKTVLEVEVTVD